MMAAMKSLSSRLHVHRCFEGPEGNFDQCKVPLYQCGRSAACFGSSNISAQLQVV